MSGVVKYLWVGVIFFIGIKSYGQQDRDIRLVDQKYQNLLFSELGSKEANAINYADIKGTPYYTDDFRLADIQFKNGTVIKDVNIRLNLYSKTLEFKRGDEILEMIQMQELDRVGLYKEQITLINDTEIAEEAGFYKIEVDGKYQLLEFLQVTFFDATEAKSFYEDDTPAEFKRQKEKYYLRLENNPPIAFGNKKNFEKIFKKDFPELVKFAKDNKLNPAKYKDLIKMVEFLNSL